MLDPTQNPNSKYTFRTSMSIKDFPTYELAKTALDTLVKTAGKRKTGKRGRKGGRLTKKRTKKRSKKHYR